MPNLDSFRHVVIDSMLNVIKHDTGAIKVMMMSPTTSGTNAPQNNLITAVGAIVCAVIGGLITIWYKWRELKNLSQNLLLQQQNTDLIRQRFEQDKIVQNNQMYSELAKIQDLKNKYQLSLKEFDYTQNVKILDMVEKSTAGFDTDKLNFMKELNTIVKKIKDHFPPSRSVEDKFEWDREIASHIFSQSKFYRDKINSIIIKYPHLNEIKELEGIENEMKNLEYNISDETGNEGVDDESVFDYYVKEIIMIYDRLQACFNRCFENFNAYEKIRNEFIEDRFNNKQTNDPATT